MKLNKLFLSSLIAILIISMQSSDVTAFDPRLVDTYHYSLNEGDKLIFSINFGEPIFEDGYQWENGILEVTAKSDMRNIKQPYDASSHPLNIDMLSYLEYTLNEKDIPDKVVRYLDELILFPSGITPRGESTKLNLVEFYLTYVPDLFFEVDDNKLLLENTSDGSYIVDLETGIILEWSNTEGDNWVNLKFIDLIKKGPEPIPRIETTTVTTTVTEVESVSSSLPFSFLFGLIGLVAIYQYPNIKFKTNSFYNREI